MTSTTQKAKAWKRVVVSLVGLLAVGASVALCFVGTESSRGTFCKWAVLPLLFGGGIWFVTIGIRGRTADVDDTVSRIFF